MVYFIELIVSLKKSVNLHTIKANLLAKAEECCYIDFYDNYNIEGKNRTILKNQCILTFMFEEHDELFADFIVLSNKGLLFIKRDSPLTGITANIFKSLGF